VEYLTRLGASLIIMGEREIARGISEHIRGRADAVTADAVGESAPQPKLS
jgi:CPA2 family monovalent cation:H+ antiporter-2